MTIKEIRELRDKLSDMEFEKKVCPDCNGSGVYQEYDEYDRYTVHSCATCDGSGEIVRQSVKSEDSFPDFDPHARRTEPGRMSSRYIPKTNDPYSKESVSDKNGEVRIIRPAKEKE